MKPTNAGKINANVQPCTFPIVESRRNETALTSQHMTPLTLVCLTGSRSLSKIEPTIASKLPMRRAGMKICERMTNSKPSVFSKPCRSN